MSSINNQNNNETSGFNREGKYQPNTTGERVATHIPGTEAHAERNDLQGRTSPGARALANVPGTAEHERKREPGTGLTESAYDTRDNYGGTGRVGVGNTQTGDNYNTQAGKYSASADPTDRGAAHVHQGTAPLSSEHGAGTEKRVSASDKILGTAEKTLGKAMNKPAMAERGVERQLGKERANVPPGAYQGAQPGSQQAGF